MRQDLAFETAEVRWEGPEASVAFRFEAFHPPYASSTHAGGCPPYAADDRIEQRGRITGTLRIGDRVIELRTMRHGAHRRGTRARGALPFYCWPPCHAGEDLTVTFRAAYALGMRQS